MKKSLALSLVFLGVVFLSGCGQAPVSQIEPITSTPVLEQSAPMKEDPVNQPVEVSNETAGWRSYTNDVYKYKISYPAGTIIKEAQESDFGMSPEESASGLTFADVFNKYTGKICITVNSKYGDIYISAKENKDSRYVMCSGRTGVGSGAKITTIKESIVVDGENYEINIQDIVEEGKHNYATGITLNDGTTITISSDSMETYEELKKIVESYSSIQ